MYKRIKEGFLTGNQLKLFAALVMTIDHIGAYLFPKIGILRIIGRLAFPIFAYMIGEGCSHTKNKKKYLLMMVGASLIFQIVYFVIFRSLSMCIFVTFSLSIILCDVFEYAMKREESLKGWFAALICLAAVYVVCDILPGYLRKYGFDVDYGFWGVLVPVAVFLGRGKQDKLLFMTVALSLLALQYGFVQWYALLAVPILALYNGKRGTLRMKYFFYIYYPLHLAVIYFIGFLL